MQSAFFERHLVRLVGPIVFLTVLKLPVTFASSIRRISRLASLVGNLQLQSCTENLP